MNTMAGTAASAPDKFRSLTMPSFQTILIAADFSDRSRQAFDVACALAEEPKTRLFVLHVLEPTVSVDERGIPLPLPAIDTEHRVTLMEQLRTVYAPPRPLDVQYHVCEGLVAEEILRAAAKVGADLIVLGTHGRTGVRRLLAGSVAETVLRRARVSVLALHAPEAKVLAPKTIRVILHPTDFSARSQAALRVARSLARDRGAKLVLLFVAPIETLQGVALAMPRNPELDLEPLEALRVKTDGSDLKYPVELRYATGEPATEIAGVADEIGCDLIVLGTHGRTGLGRLLMGSVAEAVLRRASCPTLIVRPNAEKPVPAPGEPEPLTVSVF
jgi:nucleotide-binding universal stress UspA family protein